MVSEERTEVVVVGGGISGLSAAAALQVLKIHLKVSWEEVCLF